MVKKTPTKERESENPTDIVTHDQRAALLRKKPWSEDEDALVRKLV